MPWWWGSTSRKGVKGGVSLRRCAPQTSRGDRLAKGSGEGSRSAAHGGQRGELDGKCHGSSSWDRRNIPSAEPAAPAILPRARSTTTSVGVGPAFVGSGAIAGTAPPGPSRAGSRCACGELRPSRPPARLQSSRRWRRSPRTRGRPPRWLWCCGLGAGWPGRRVQRTEHSCGPTTRSRGFFLRVSIQLATLAPMSGAA